MTAHQPAFSLDRRSFPLTIQLLDAVARNVVWETTVSGPGAIRIPGRDETNEGRLVAVRMKSGDGPVRVIEPNPEAE